MFDGFELGDVEVTEDVRIRFRHGGDGPGLLLLHGNPQTHVMWHKVAGPLAERYHVVAADLRGYGDSSAPEPGENHRNYSFRAMAQDQVRLMAHLGYDEFLVVGHDRGARVVHRMCLDHPERVRRAAVLDILPTHHIFTHMSMQSALQLWHWSFMAQPADLPERMMGSVPPEWYLQKKMSKSHAGSAAFSEEALAEYARCFTAKTIRGSCEDYRAAATCDFEMDAADLGRKVASPLLVLWGYHSHTQQAFGDVLEVWRDRAEQVEGGPIQCGHYLPEEAPGAVLEALLPFLEKGAAS